MKKQLLICGLILFSVSSYAQYRYNAPQQLDASPMVNAATALQQRYNYNKNRFQDALDDISRGIRKLNRSEEQQELLLDLFREKCFSKALSVTDFGSNDSTKYSINFLYDCVNYQIKNN